MNHGVEQCTLSNHPAHTLSQAMISKKKNRKITSKFLKTVLMNLHEQICFLKDKSIKVNNSDRTNRKAEEEKCGKDFCKWYFFPVSGSNILFLAVSDWIWSITEIACQSTDKKATFFFLFPVHCAGRNIWFHTSFANCCGDSRKPIWLYKIDEWEKKNASGFVSVAFGSCTPGTLANWALLMIHCHSAIVKMLKLL